MKKIFLCGHTGSYNHGCEALVRSTSKVYRKAGIEDIFLASHYSLQDFEFEVDKEVNIIEYNNHANQLSRCVSLFQRGVLRNYEKAYAYIQTPLWDRLDEDSICLNIGGDTYCYKRPYISYSLTSHNMRIGVPTIFWGCSIEKNLVDDEMIKDLKRYSLIIPRETTSYNTLIEIGIPKEKMFLCCDPAFQLDIKEMEIPVEFRVNKTIGLNLSPLVINEYNSNDKVFKNVQVLIDYILKETDYSICLIPHVYNYEEQNQDVDVLNAVKELYKDEERILMINDKLNAMQLKYIISKCRFFIGARTHATIAAYSSNVPTLVIGYSVKSIGIAKDIFGTYDGFVIPYNEIENSDLLKSTFINLMINEENILKRYVEFMPSYKERVIKATNFVLDNMGRKNE